jgi:hypothetical protein
MSMHAYRGFEIYPLVYSHAQKKEGSGHNFEDGFDAAVKICVRGADAALTYSNTFKLDEGKPFPTAGAARRASLKFGEGIIDQHGGESWTPA